MTYETYEVLSASLEWSCMLPHDGCVETFIMRVTKIQFKEIWASRETTSYCTSDSSDAIDAGEGSRTESLADSSCWHVYSSERACMRSLIVAVVGLYSKLEVQANPLLHCQVKVMRTVLCYTPGSSRESQVRASSGPVEWSLYSQRGENLDPVDRERRREPAG